VPPPSPKPTPRSEDAVSDPVRYPERERRFMGCVRVPIGAVYQAGVLQGSFKLEVADCLRHFEAGSRLGEGQRHAAPALLLHLTRRIARRKCFVELSRA
jgi:hypothetical protein